MNIEKNNIKEQLKNKLTEKGICGIVLALAFVFFSSHYVQDVVMPQNGWWHYFAWRVTKGDVLYKDCYLFIPPYFTMFTALLFELFKTNFFMYTIFIGLPIKISIILLLYSILCRFVKPRYAAFSVFVGACISATFLMDAWYDYNPILMLPCILIGYNMMKFYDNREVVGFQKDKYCLFNGIWVSVLLMSKQTFGISFFALVVIMMIVLLIKEHIRGMRTAVCYGLLGLLVGLLPGVIYFLKNNCWKEFVECMIMATNAKGGGEGLVSHFVDILGDYNAWFIAITLFGCVKSADKLWNGNCIEVDKNRILYKNLFGICSILSLLNLGCFFSEAINSVRKYLLTDKILILQLCSIALLLIFIGMISRIFSHKENINIILWITLLVVIFCAMLIISRYDSEKLEEIYYGFNVFNSRRQMLTVASYLFILFWISELTHYFIYHDKDYSLLMAWTVISMHFFVGIVSAACFEEIFMILYLPFVFVIFFSIKVPVNRLKNGLLLFVFSINIILCLVSKLYIPYDWQGWREPSITNDEFYCTVPGLYGYKVPSNVDQDFKEICKIINENCKEDDTVYQFANIPLFNVLCMKKIPTYAPIGWFDVCPDEVAKKDAELLTNNPPKVVVWHNLNEGEWYYIESIFRNGGKSGQRDILDFYNNIVKNQYSLAKEIDNNRDGTIQVWVRNDK